MRNGRDGDGGWQAPDDVGRWFLLRVVGAAFAVVMALAVGPALCFPPHTSTATVRSVAVDDAPRCRPWYAVPPVQPEGDPSCRPAGRPSGHAGLDRRFQETEMSSVP